MANASPVELNQVLGEIRKIMPGWAGAVAEAMECSQQESEESALADACRVASSDSGSGQDPEVVISDEEAADEVVTVEQVGRHGPFIVPMSPQTSDDSWFGEVKFGAIFFGILRLRPWQVFFNLDNGQLVVVTSYQLAHFRRTKNQIKSSKKTNNKPLNLPYQVTHDLYYLLSTGVF